MVTDANCDERSPKRKRSEVEIIAEPVDIKSGRRDLANDSVNEEMEVELLHEGESIDTLRKRLKGALQKCRQYEKKLKQQKNSPLESIFNEDQLDVLQKGTCRGGMRSDQQKSKIIFGLWD